jgi:hypothetical protein
VKSWNRLFGFKRGRELGPFDVADVAFWIIGAAVGNEASFGASKYLEDLRDSNPRVKAADDPCTCFELTA